MDMIVVVVVAVAGVVAGVVIEPLHCCFHNFLMGLHTEHLVHHLAHNQMIVFLIDWLTKGLAVDH